MNTTTITKSRGIRTASGRGKALTAGAAAAGAAALALLAAAGPASAAQFYGGTLHPGEQRCVQQHAEHKVRADGTATQQGAKFKLQYQGVTVPGTGSPGLVSAWAVELRDTNGTFPGAGDYTACVTNNGTANTNVRLNLKTDGEFV
ncbi:hypothetical protein GCM10010329_27230 [Streptomyces spiroverticillatus]|uniref:Uncharacterized protein n=1 Tax=Streptomyces finlayi TaxID=67296 RepID=A0A918WVL2_9ACTN|nr:hypothetical protein [Streptomyces finlayi]GHA03451.1 hypothetical protein GCM10010329_27230 [Streptomyces spiroverticillatus]GHC87613.1 hypothetical protein GCM10010334_19640 [Streptomyces finlayi]